MRMRESCDSSGGGDSGGIDGSEVDGGLGDGDTVDGDTGDGGLGGGDTGDGGGRDSGDADGGAKGCRRRRMSSRGDGGGTSSVGGRGDGTAGGVCRVLSPSCLSTADLATSTHAVPTSAPDAPIASNQTTVLLSICPTVPVPMVSTKALLNIGVEACAENTWHGTKMVRTRTATAAADSPYGPNFPSS